MRDRYDYILIDTPPSLGLLTINAFVAATGVIVPVQCEYLSLRGLVQLENTLAMVRENLNPGVEIEGILPTMFDRRTLHSREAVEILEENFGELVFQTRIRKTVRYAEAPVKGAVRAQVRPDRRGRRGLPRTGEGGARWRESARACVRDRSPSCSARPKRRSGRPRDEPASSGAAERARRPCRPPRTKPKPRSSTRRRRGRARRRAEEPQEQTVEHVPDFVAEARRGRTPEPEPPRHAPARAPPARRRLRPRPSRARVRPYEPPEPPRAMPEPAPRLDTRRRRRSRPTSP